MRERGRLRRDRRKESAEIRAAQILRMECTQPQREGELSWLE